MIKQSMNMASTSMGGVDPATAQINKFRSYVNMLADPTCKDDSKLKATQEISENFETIMTSSMYPSFLDHAVKIFLKMLQEWEPYFISEYNIQQVRKLILEILYRLPTNDLLKPYVKPILTLSFRLLEIDNEENVLVCLKIIIELHKQYRPTYNSTEIPDFLLFVKQIYSDFPSHMNKILEPRQPIVVEDLSDLNLEELLKTTYIITPIQTEKRNEHQMLVCGSYNLLPKAKISLKVLQELPIIVVLMYQLYKQTVHQDVSDFIPLIMNTIVLQPSVQLRQSDTFNREIFGEFLGAQIKTLSFLAYIVKIYQDLVSNHSSMLVQGMLGLLLQCPMEAANLRRELLIAYRHILSTELRIKFVPYMDKLFDEDVLLGRGWTTYESLRPVAFSTLGDLVVHVRQHLSMSDMARAVHLFGKNILDDTLTAGLQTVSAKVVVNLVDCIKKRAEAENVIEEGRGLLLRMLEIFVLKFKVIAKTQLPKIVEKCKQQQQQTATTAVATPQTAVEVKTEVKVEPDTKPTDGIDNALNTQKEEKCKFGFPPQLVYSFTEYRILVKTLVVGAKNIAWGCVTCKASNSNGAAMSAHQFAPHETLIFIRLIKWALKTLDIFTLTSSPAVSGPARITQQMARAKEEKEVLEHFSSVFTMMHTQTFQEIFMATIECIVECVYKNAPMQAVPNSLLVNPSTSPIFGAVLVEYLLERMEEMDENAERSELYLRLYKLIFGSVSLYPNENENMLRPYLHKIVNKSMSMGIAAKEPYNYFLLMRALFRAIGGGTHDLLYQEFLPLLPSLLDGLYKLQCGVHTYQMQELFVELCLTVPVRLSSLLPYIPILMDPLVAALNSSMALVAQGLRTLELCVDNLQLEFLNEHVQPVRRGLLEALWNIVRGSESTSYTAFKVLGKLAGGNRRLIGVPPKLNYVEADDDPPCIIVHFHDQPTSIELPVEKIIQTAFKALRKVGTDSFLLKQAWDVIQGYLIASLDLSDERNTLINLFMHHSFLNGDNIPHGKGLCYKSNNKKAREIHKTALTGMFVAASLKELKPLVLSTLVNVVRHYTLVAVAQMAGPFAISPRPNERASLDPLVLVDSIADIMGHEAKELINPGNLALKIIIHAATKILGSIELACKLPIVEYISEKMVALCYERAWYRKMGGCKAITFLVERCAREWVYEHVFTFHKALLFILMDMTGEVSYGTIDAAKHSLDVMLIFLITTPPKYSDVQEKHSKALHKVTYDIVRQVTSPHENLRKQAMHSLKLIAERTNRSITDVMEPFKDVLADMIPPRKHLMRHQPAVAQMGLMDGNMFCTTLTPRLFSMDMSIKVVKTFISDIMYLCSTEDTKLNNLYCYKNITDFTPLKISGLRCLAACHYLEEVRENIFEILYKSLEKPNPELQETAYEAMKMFNAGCPVGKEIHKTMRPLLLIVGDTDNALNLTVNNLKMMVYLTKLFPNVFNENLCDKLIIVLKKILDNLVTQNKSSKISKHGDEEQKIIHIITFFHQTPSASIKFVRLLSQPILQAERTLIVEFSSPFREELMKFFLRYPIETVEMFIEDVHIRDRHYGQYFEYIIRHQDGKKFRDYLQTLVHRLISLTGSNVQTDSLVSESDWNEMQFRCIRLVYLLINKDDQWLSNQHELVDAFKKIWCNDEYLQKYKSVEMLNCMYWKEPKMLMKILLHSFCHHPNNIDLLFQLLRPLCDRYILDYQFLRDFLENTVSQNYTVEWKRRAFFLFVDQFPTTRMTQELKAKVLQYILIPCFAVSFDRGECNKLIGTMPAPYHDSPENIVSVFINKLVDPESPHLFVDCVRISLLQFSCLLVDQASMHIHDHDSHNKAVQSYKLRRLMTFAWPCLLGKNCVDATARFHGHLLLAHIIHKFAIHKKIVLQVFHSLLKAHGAEARGIVRQALEILTPAMPIRMEEGHKMLVHWTKKMIIDEGHQVAQLFHVLQLVVRHYKVYYPVRHSLVQYMMNSIQRLGFNPTPLIEHRRLAVELAEVIIKWELKYLREELDAQEGVKQNFNESDQQRKRLAVASTSDALPVPVKIEPRAGKPLEKAHSDNVLNFLLRLACQVSDSHVLNVNNAAGTSSGEILSRRCISLLKTALKPDVWPHPIELKLGFMEKLLLSVEQPNANIGSICTALEILAFLVTTLKKEQVLAHIKPLQKAIGACVTSSNNKVIRIVQVLLHRLMGVFPTERTNSNMTCKYDELEILYSTVGKMIFEGLTNYEKNASALSSSLYPTIMILKAACLNNNSYIDILITPFMRVLHRITKEHLQPTHNETCIITSELVIVSLELIKNRVIIMAIDMRRAFIFTILLNLIEKTQDTKVMKAILKIVEEWVKGKTAGPQTQAPGLKEKSVLLVKLMQYWEKRFGDDQDLSVQFLELIYHIYTDEQLKQTELVTKLEQAFLYGLRYNQQQIRTKFFKVIDESMRKRLFDRLLYITSSQNWENIGPHYWIKQCIELLLVTALPKMQIQMSHESSILPGICSVVNAADKEKQKEFHIVKQENITSDVKIEIKEEVVEAETNEETTNSTEKETLSREEIIMKYINKDMKFIEVSKNATTYNFLMAVSQICHLDNELAEWVWLQLFPKIWGILDEQQKNTLTQEITAFLGSGAHVGQKDSVPNSIQTFVEGLARCTPPVQLISPLMRYLGKAHNIHYRLTLSLEQMAFESGATTKQGTSSSSTCYDFEPEQSTKSEMLDSLADLYSSIGEEDMWAGLWQRHAHYRETSTAVAYEQHGFFEQAQTAYENAMAKHKQDNSMGPIPTHTQREVHMWNEHWIRCAKELKQWDVLYEYSKNGVYDPFLLLEYAWKAPNWELAKESLSNAEHNVSKELQWKLLLYGGYLLVCNPEDKPLKFAERYIESTTNRLMQEWRKLPTLVSFVHFPVLQATQQILELHETYLLRKILLAGHPNALSEMKNIFKVWKNREPGIFDDLAFWNDIYMWRHLQYEYGNKYCEKLMIDQQTSVPTNPMVAVHAMAQTYIAFGRIARKHKMTTLALDTLNKIYSIPSVPITDCFQKIRQQIKCFLQQGSMGNKNDYQEGLEVVNAANAKFFTKEMNAEFYALKGLLYQLSGKSDEANKAFSAATQLQDTSIKAWSLYGEYLEQVFTRDPRQISLGVNAMTCFLHAIRQQNEEKARKYVGKILWLLSYDDDKNSLMKPLDKYSVGVQPVMWLPWVPQLLNCLVMYDGNVILNLILQVGKMFPQAVYFPIRTLYLNLKSLNLRAATARKMNTAQQQSNQDNQDQTGQQQQSGQEGSTSNTAPVESSIKASPAMVRCSKIMKLQRDLHTTVLSSLEGFADQMDWFREYWYEEVLRQLRQGLTKCYAIAFENRESVNEVKVTPHIINFVKKVMSTFGVGDENITSQTNAVFNSAASEILARRAEATYQDPVFQEMKQKFTKDFDFSQPNAMRLRTLIFKLKKWIKILENHSKILVKSFLLEDTCRFIANFTLKTAEVEIPGEFLMPMYMAYHVKISKFLPRVDIVQKLNAAARRLYIRGHNGKIYPYLVVNDSGLADARREERVLQLLRMTNHLFEKQKETCRRLLSFTVQRVVAVSQVLRFVEDNVASISMLDIFKKACKKLNIEHDGPIHYYYDRLANVQSRGIKASHQVYRDILKGIQTTMVPRTILKQFVQQSFPGANEYWQFRKIFTMQMALACFTEYVFHLTRLNPDMMYIHQDTGQVTISYFKFDVDDNTGELDITRPVPFRLTPNIIEYITSIGISGPLTASMIAAARCMIYPNFKLSSLLKPILRDEMLVTRINKPDDTDNSGKDEKLTENDNLINAVNKAVTSINNRLSSLAHFDGVDSKVGTLVAAANSHDNLCRMDPTWHPWL